MEDLLASDLVVLPVEPFDFLKALELQRQHSLLTNDSLHLAAGLRAGLTMVATNDSRMNDIPEITFFRPSDVL